MANRMPTGDSGPVVAVFSRLFFAAASRLSQSAIPEYWLVMIAVEKPRVILAIGVNLGRRFPPRAS